MNKMFDPNFHQAMLEIEDDKVEPGTILQEIQSGYMFGERLLRPSFVGISKKKRVKMSKLNKIMPCIKIFRPHIQIVNKGKHE